MDMNAIMRQAQEMQQKMSQVQEELAKRTVDASVGGGMVTATVSGKNELLAIKIEKQVIDPEDQAMLQDLVVSAVNEALRKAQDMAQAEMRKLTGGMNIPGLF
jgi:DNA-binding YbaB/EbfC family protein